MSIFDQRTMRVRRIAEKWRIRALDPLASTLPSIP
jgi:hypothetical protein